MKVLILDIETAPNLAYVWGMFDQNVGGVQVEEWSSVICFAARWHGKRKVHFHSDFHDGHEAMVEAAWRLMDEADAVVHYNGRGFDIKHLHREFLLAGMGPPSPHKDIDLLLTMRSRFKFPSNKLDNVAQAVGVGQKVPHTGFELWKGCMAGDPKAWKLMKKYNVGDITVTEDLYERLKPWIKNHPHVGLHDGSPYACPCGSMDVQKRGVYATNALLYQRYWCKACGRWSRGERLPDSEASKLRSI